MFALITCCNWLALFSKMEGFSKIIQKDRNKNQKFSFCLLHDAGPKRSGVVEIQKSCHTHWPYIFTLLHLVMPLWAQVLSGVCQSKSSAKLAVIQGKPLLQRTRTITMVLNLGCLLTSLLNLQKYQLSPYPHQER